MYRPFAMLCVIGGCYDPTIHPGAPCTTNADCPVELSCIDMVCGGVPKDGRADFPDVPYFDAPGTNSIDSSLPPDGGAAACANFDLGSALGAVATGNTQGHADTYKSCNGQGSPDVSYAWTAPATAMFTMDLCASPNQDFDSTLYVRDGSCTGTQLACDDDGCMTNFLSKLKVSLTAGQLVIIIVDGDTDQGKYTLTITQD
ncbi:MAG TPA: hypothetical protein VMJ10_07250 [Kofleriaceae bacterium]|nr:hypothetical protein [Kofleriaceae bacterium]